MITAFASVYLVGLIFQTLEPPGDPRERSFILPAWWFPRFVRDANPMGQRAVKVFGWLRHLGPGFVRDDGRPYPEHIVVILATVLAFVIYVGGFYLGWRRLAYGFGTTQIPALAYLEFLILCVALVLSILSF